MPSLLLSPEEAHSLKTALHLAITDLVELRKQTTLETIIMPNQATVHDWLGTALENVQTAHTILSGK